VPTPILFTSGKFLAAGGSFENFSQVAFEADIPAIEGRTCNRVNGGGLRQSSAWCAFLSNLYHHGAERAVLVAIWRCSHSRHNEHVRRELGD
jgi:hypothetical protein